MRNNKFAVFFILFIVSAIVLFFISPDAPTHYMYNRCDSAIFFMCGKAWMNGMIPYVDFTDSKGPLLWFFYGLGYLLSPRNYYGVYIISCLIYTGTYYYTFKLSSIFISDKRLALLSTLLMTVFYFCPLYHYETRAEDFCLPFVMLALYNTSKILFVEEHHNIENIKRISISIGLAFGATLLIKYTIAAMLTIFGAYIWIEIRHSKKKILTSIVWTIYGLLIILTPFIVIFLIKGNLYDFINQYFITTLYTVNELQTSSQGGLYNLALIIVQNSTIILALVIISSTPIWLSFSQKHSSFPVICCLFFILICIQNAKWSYYFSICAPFCIFAIISFVNAISNHLTNKSIKFHIITTSIIIIFTIVSNYHYYYYSIDSVGFFNLIFQKNNDMRKTYQYYSGIICEYGIKPRIIYIDTQCNPDYSVAAEGLPGCKNWSMQNGATKEMIDFTWSAIIAGKADFVVTTSKESAIKLKELGYCQIPNKGAPHYLFQRNN